MGTDQVWWQRRGAIVAALLLAAIPFLWPAVPPLIDLPGHMASYHVALSLDRSADLRRFFDFHWALIGNLGVDLLVMPFGRLIGVEAATKLVMILVPVATVLGIAACARAVHGRVPAPLAFAFPLAYCYPLFFGFVNYCAGAAIVLLALALWLRWPSTRRPLARALVFLLLAAAVWLAHAIAWLMLALACGAAELRFQLVADRRTILGALVRTALHCLPLVILPVLFQLTGPKAASHDIAIWLKPFEIVKWSVTLLRDRWLVWDVASALVVLAASGLALIRWGGLRLDGRLGWPALAWFAAYLLLPRQIAGSDYFGTRIVPYAFMLLIAAIDAERLTPTRRRAVALAAWAFFAARMAGNTASALIYDRAWRQQLEALDHVERGARIATFSPMECASSLGNWSSPRLAHISGLATVRRDAYINSLWTLTGLQLLRVHYPPAGALTGDPSQTLLGASCGPVHVALPDALNTLPRAGFDYVWLIDWHPEAWPRLPWLRPVWTGPNAALYRIAR